MKSLLIAGGGGIIGSELNKYLKETYEIININQSKSKNAFQINLLDDESLEHFVKESKRFDCMVFLVGLAHFKGKKAQFHRFHDINYRTLVNLLTTMEKFEKVPKKIIFSSTIAVYGEKMDKEIYDETSKLFPESPYSITKLKAEKYLLQKFKKKTWIIRLSPVYSESVLLNIQRRIKIGLINFVVGDGKTKLSLCNVKNLVKIIDEIIVDKIKVGIYNLSDNNHYTYDDLVKWSNVRFIIKIPRIFVKVAYYFGKLINNIFLIENSIKLLSHNIYPSNKIQKYTFLPYTLLEKD